MEFPRLAKSLPGQACANEGGDQDGAGYLDNLESDQFSFENICQAMARGSVTASYTCEAFSTLKLQEISKEDLSNRLDALREIGHW